MDPTRPTDEEIIQKIKQKLCNQQMVFISSQYPMNAEGYILKEQIGEGMMSNKVYLAECLMRENERVAIKQIDLSQQSNDTKEKITKEVQGMSVVTSSEYVVRFHCSFVFEETLWIVMDLQEGSVRDVLKWKYPHGIDDETVLCTILYQALQGINFLHEQYMIHRDIKAGNILFNKEGQIKLADFGVSALLESHDERRTTMAGTWHWMAPEVIDPSDHGGHDFKADIWSLGITCIELAYGVAPYGDARPNQVIVYIMQNPPPTLDNPRVPTTNIKKYSTTFKEFVTKCLQTDPKKRPTAAKLLTHKFVKEAVNSSILKQALLEGLPSIGDRFRRQQEIRKENFKANLAKSGNLPNLKLRASKDKSKSRSPRGTPSKNSQHNLHHNHGHNTLHHSSHSHKDKRAKDKTHVESESKNGNSPRRNSGISPRTPPASANRSVSREDMMLVLPREKNASREDICTHKEKRLPREHSPNGKERHLRDDHSPQEAMSREHSPNPNPQIFRDKKISRDELVPKKKSSREDFSPKLSREHSPNLKVYRDKKPSRSELSPKEKKATETHEHSPKERTHERRTREEESSSESESS